MGCALTSRGQFFTLPYCLPGQIQSYLPYGSGDSMFGILLQVLAEVDLYCCAVHLITLHMDAISCARHGLSTILDCNSLWALVIA